MATDDPRTGEFVRKVAPWIPVPYQERFSRLAALWALSKGKFSLAQRLAPEDEEIMAGVQQGLRDRLVSLGLYRANQLGLSPRKGVSQVNH